MKKRYSNIREARNWFGVRLSTVYTASEILKLYGYRPLAPFYYLRKREAFGNTDNYSDYIGTFFNVVGCLQDNGEFVFATSPTRCGQIAFFWQGKLMSMGFTVIINQN